MQLLIAQELAQKILNYLVKQPYADVAEFVAGMVQLPVAPEPPVSDTLAEEAAAANAKKAANVTELPPTPPTPAQ